MCNGNSTFPIFNSAFVVNKDFSDLVVTMIPVSSKDEIESIARLSSQGLDNEVNV
jgi:hypothetical protein